MTWIGDRLVALEACVGEALVDRGSGDVCWLGVLPGSEVALDFCTECDRDRCGMAWVRLTQAYPSTVFPDQDVEFRNCRTRLAYVVEVGVARCLPLTVDNSPPEAADMLTTTLSVTDDMLALRYAVQCCFGDSVHVLGAWQPFGPDGGCVGGTWTVQVANA